MKWSVNVVCGTEVRTSGMWHERHSFEELTAQAGFGGPVWAPAARSSSSALVEGVEEASPVWHFRQIAS